MIPTTARILMIHRLFAKRIFNRAIICCSNGVSQKVSFESRAGKKIDLFNKDDEFLKKFSNISQNYSTESDRDYWEDALIVKTTGIMGKDGETLCARIGVFWGDKDEMNVYKPVDVDNDSVISLPLAELESVNMALRQAIYERGVNRLIVKTDSEFVIKVVERWLTGWKNNGFIKKDGSPVKNQQYIEELDRLLSMIEAKFVYSNHKTRFDNDVVNSLRLNEDLVSKIDADEHMFGFQSQIVNPPSSGNVLYASGVIKDSSSMTKRFVLGGYGVHFPERPDLDKCGRFAEFPITLFRAQMQAIVVALDVAKRNKLKDVYIVTDSDRFLRFHRMNWTKKDGTPVANQLLYKRIIALQKDVNAKFSFMPCKFDKKIEQAMLLAEDGLAYPVEVPKSGVNDRTSPSQPNPRTSY